MKIVWAKEAWQDYLYWQKNDKHVLKRINRLIEDAGCHPFEGIGDPEPLRYAWSGYWSRRINREHLLVYQHTEDALLIAQCRYHY